MVSAALDDSGRRRPRRPSLRRLRLFATVVAAAVIVAAVLAPRLGAVLTSPSPTGSPGPTFNLPAALDAQVDQAGLMRSGGIWAVQGSYLLTSTDNGASWRAGDFPSVGGLVPVEPVYVLDRDHAWAVESSPATGAGELLTVERTSDGGGTWQQSTVSANFGCDTATLSFVDPLRGFIMCSVASRAGAGSAGSGAGSAGSGAGSAGSGGASGVASGAARGSGTVLRTVDGGASWSVAGGAAGLGSGFAVGDSSTLWSAPDCASSTLTGAALYVSRNAGGTWSTVNLPEMSSIPAGVQTCFTAGPVFWDASNGAIAVWVGPGGSGGGPAVWFYRTADAGRSWTVVKKPTPWATTAIASGVLVGREWAIPDGSGLFGLAMSGDFGASWVDVPGFGMPQNGAFLWLDFTDATHGAAVVSAVPGASFARSLMLSSDGGRTWHATDYGDARANVLANPTLDPAAARNVADEFQTMATKDPQAAWIMLSSYSQRAYGSEAAFEATEAALGKRTGGTYQLGQPTPLVLTPSHTSPAQGIDGDLATFADTSRIYVTVVTFPGTSEPGRKLIAAPLSVNGDWRVWVVTGS